MTHQHTQPTDHIVKQMAMQLLEDQQEYFQERSAIRQYEGHFERPHAEALAMLETVTRYGWPPITAK